MTLNEIDKLISEVKIGQKVFIRNSFNMKGIIAIIENIDEHRILEKNIDFKAHCIHLVNNSLLWDIRTMVYLNDYNILKKLNQLESDIQCLK